MTPEQRRTRGVAANAIINDATIMLAWQEIENELRAQWEACWLPRKRDRIWNELKHLKALRQRLVSYTSHAPRD